ncbi:MAG: oligosaccharide flippase family protein [bacterium]
MSLRRRVGLDLATTAGAHAVYKLAALVVMMILTRSLSKESFGSFTFATSIAGIGIPFTALGLTTLLVRDIAVDRARASEHASRALAIRIPLLALLVAVLAAGTAIIRPPLAAIVFWSTLALALDEIALTFGSYFSGLERFRLASALGVGGKLLGIAAVFVAALAGAGVVGFVVAMVLANAVRLAATIVAARLTGFRWTAHATRDAREKRDLVVRALPLFALGATATLHFRGDAVLLGWLGTFALVATYETAFRLFEAAQFVTRPVAMVFYPLFANRLAAGEREWVAARFRRILAIAIAAGVAGAALVYALAGPLVPVLFGAAYTESVPVLRTLYLALPSFLVVVMCGMTARAMGLERRVLLISVACLVIGLAAKALLIPRAGVLGVAWCTSIVFVLQAVAVARLVLRALAQPVAPAHITPGAEYPEAPVAI